MKELFLVVTLNICCLIFLGCEEVVSENKNSQLKKEQYFSGDLTLKKINVTKDSSYARVVSTSTTLPEIERLVAVQTSWNRKTIVILESKQGSYVEVGGSHTAGFYAKLVKFNREGIKEKVGVLKQSPKNIAEMQVLLWTVYENEMEFNEKYDWYYLKSEEQEGN